MFYNIFILFYINKKLKNKIEKKYTKNNNNNLQSFF